MVEPLGAASGVLGVAEVGFSLAATLYKYASSVKSAEKELKAIAKDVELTSKVLKQTHEQIQKDQNIKLCSGEALDLTSDVLSGCQDAFREVDEALKGSIKTDASGKASVTIAARMKWPLKSGKLEVLRANLEKLKTTLLLMLSVLAYGRKVMDSRTLPDTKADLSLDKLQIQNLVEARDEATRRYEELSSAFARFEARLDSNANVQSSPLPPAYSTSMYMTTDSHLDQTRVSNPPDPQNIGTSSEPINARVSDCLDLCTSAVLQLAITIEDATRRWHETQTLEHQHVNDSLRAAVEAVTHLSNEGTAWSRSPLMVPSSKRSTVSSPSHQSTQSGRSGYQRSSSPAKDVQPQMQVSWNPAGTGHTSNNVTYFPPPSLRPPISFASPIPSLQRLPPQLRVSNPTGPSREQSTSVSQEKISMLSSTTEQTWSSSANRGGQTLELSRADERRISFAASKGEQVFEIPVHAGSGDDSDDSDDGLFAVASTKQRQKPATSPGRLSLTLGRSTLGTTNGYEDRTIHRPEVKSGDQKKPKSSIDSHPASRKYDGEDTLDDEHSTFDLLSDSADAWTGASHSGSSQTFGNGTWACRPPVEFIMEHFERFFQEIDPGWPISGESTQDRDFTPSRQLDLNVRRGQLMEKDVLGRVYFGMNTKTTNLLIVREVDIKALNVDRAKLRELFGNLATEVEKLKSLRHSNIARYLGCDCTAHSMYTLQQYVSGGSIGSCLRSYGKLEEPVVSSITRQILGGLSYMHAEGVFHRHLKADNILLDLDGQCIISEFCTSRCIADLEIDEMDRMERDIYWTAPEIVQRQSESDFTNVDDDEAGAKADIWSLGCVVLEMLAGRRPWAGHEAISVIYKLGFWKQAPPIPDDVATGVSPPTLAFLYDCFTIDQNERPIAEVLLRASMCVVDPDFNFRDTGMYAHIRDSTWLQNGETITPDNFPDRVNAENNEPISHQQPQKAIHMPSVQVPSLSLSVDHDVDGGFVQMEHPEPYYDVVDDLLHRWTTITV